MYWMENIGPALLANLWQSSFAYLMLFFFRRSKSTTPQQSYILGVTMQLLLAILFFSNILDNQHPYYLVIPNNIIPDSTSIILTRYYISYTYIILLSINYLLFFIKYLRQLPSKKANNNFGQAQELSDNVKVLLDNWKVKLGILRPIKLIIRNTLIPPFTKGLLKPIIIVPLSFINGLDNKQMEAVLLHELWHIKRYDYLFLIIQLLLEKIMYFNPFYLLIGKALHEDRELSCDIKAINISSYSSINYIETIILLNKQNNPINYPRLSIIGKRSSELLNRAEYILNNKKNKRFQGSFYMNILACVAFLVSISLNNSAKFRKKDTKADVVSAGIITENEMPIKLVQTPISNNEIIQIKNREKHNNNTINKSVAKLKNKNKVRAKGSLLRKNIPEKQVNNQETFVSNENHHNNKLFTRLASYIQPIKEVSDVQFKPIELGPNKALFAVNIPDSNLVDNAFNAVLDNVNKRFDIESSSFQFISDNRNNQLIEKYSTELESTNYIFLLIKVRQKIYLVITPKTLEKGEF